MRPSRFFLGALIACTGVTAAQADFEPPGNRALELRLAHLLYIADTAEPYSALSYGRQFTAAQVAGGESARLRVKLAEHASSYGLYDIAAEAYRRDQNLSVGYEARNRNWFNLAKAWYDRGFYAQAQRAYDNIFGELPDDLKNKLPPFEARLKLAQGENEDAIKLLREWRRKRVRNPVAQYNLAVALARSGKQREGAGELNDIGTMRSTKPRDLALRDQANLVLGFGYLEIGQGATARALFQRIRLDSPYTAKALLGLGWAEIAPDGEDQKHTLVTNVYCVEDPARLLPDNIPVLRRIPRKACGVPQEFRDTERFKSKEGGETEAERYRRALLPWLELIDRDPRLSAVQEGLIAVPYAYAKIGSPALADEYYAKAIAVLEPQHDSVLFAIKQLQQPTDRGAILPPGVAPDRAWFAQRWGLYTVADAPFFTEALTDEQFRIVAQSLQDMLVLRDQIINSSDRTDALSALLGGRRTALLRAGIPLPTQLLDEQEKLNNTTRHLRTLLQRVDDSIYQLGEQLRGQALEAAKDHEKRLQAYLTNARVGRVNVANITVAEGVE